MLPAAVLQQARDEILDWQGSSMSVMEISHRSAPYQSLAQKAEADLRQLLSVPSEYQVLFLQGGATGQFAAIPMNLLRKRTKVAYVNTGIWSQKAMTEAQHYAEVVEVASGASSGFCHIPAEQEWHRDEGSAYLHYTSNETIGGVEFHSIPDPLGIPLVSDMSSDLLSRPLDVSRFGLIYAGAQKNMGPAGVTVVIVREDLLGSAIRETPSILNYSLQVAEKSMLNTPPTYAWYLLGHVLEWLIQQGGLEAIAKVNQEKAETLYRAIDDSSLFHNPVVPSCRSQMNIPFAITPPGLESSFLLEAKKVGLVNLEGHRSVGGFRASIYNAMPLSGVKALVDFMVDFERRYG
jgi:phosphoserine aminotransferase